MKRPLDAVWNQISVQGKTMREAISAWWQAPLTHAGPWLADCTWDPSGKPPLSPSLATATAADDEEDKDDRGEDYDDDDDDDDDARETVSSRDAPPVPAYTSRFFCNPTCRGYPWY
jgi:hypothetical protein